MLAFKGEHVLAPGVNVAACLQLRVLLFVVEPIPGMACLA